MGQNCIHLVDFSTTSRLNDEYLWNETNYRQLRNGFETTTLPYIFSKFRELWSING